MNQNILELELYQENKLIMNKIVVQRMINHFFSLPLFRVLNGATYACKTEASIGINRIRWENVAL